MASRQTMSATMRASFSIEVSGATGDPNDIIQQAASTLSPATTNSDHLNWKPCKTQNCQNLVPPQPPLSRRRIVNYETCRQARRLRDQARLAQQIRLQVLSEGEGVTEGSVGITNEHSDNSQLTLEIHQMQADLVDMADFVRSLQHQIDELQESQRETAEHTRSLQVENPRPQAFLADFLRPGISPPLLLESSSVDTAENEQEVEHSSRERLQNQTVDLSPVSLRSLWHALKIVCYMLSLFFRCIGTVGLSFALWLLPQPPLARFQVPGDTPDGGNSDNLPPPYDSVSSAQLASSMDPTHDDFFYALLMDVSLSRWFNTMSSMRITEINLRAIARFDHARRDAFFARLIPSMDAVDRALLVDAVGRLD
ncbi:hypothetical protein C8R45DRAFT_1013487 [Mycena sanguinolenta]|nr:hypothetical protein C8R45DRAFT_1013487 [Mycena sanguinolenta]